MSLRSDIVKRNSLRRRSLGRQSRQGHGAMAPIEYASTASSAQKFTDTSISPALHVNCSVNGRSGAISLSRMKLMSKRPELIAQRDASTSRSAVQIRCDSRTSENRTSLTVKTGLHALCPTACVAPQAAMRPASSAQRCDRDIADARSPGRGFAPGLATFLVMRSPRTDVCSIGASSGFDREGAKHPFSRLA
jgi:hypothetical protein